MFNAHAHCFEEVTTFFCKITVLDPLRALEPRPPFKNPRSATVIYIFSFMQLHLVAGLQWVLMSKK